MKIAIIGDIHGNYLALMSTLRDIRHEGITTILDMGDRIGYYYHPEKIFDLLSGWSLEAVKGNHENIFLNIYYGDGKIKDEYKMAYGSGMEFGVKKICKKYVDYIAQLPERRSLEVDGRKILLCHGSPWDNNEYIYPDTALDSIDRFTKEGYDIVIMGHTHYPMVKYIGNLMLINPGSVGQPRTGSPGAYWAILDTAKMEIIHKTSQYDIENVIAEAAQIDPDVPYLQRVLQRG